jgi:hypothetical protein
MNIFSFLFLFLSLFGSEVENLSHPILSDTPAKTEEKNPEYPFPLMMETPTICQDIPLKNGME